MIIKTKVEPQPGEVFKAGDFDDNVGVTLPVTIEGSDHVGKGVITSVEVAGDGSCAWVTMDVPGLASDGVDLGEMRLLALVGPDYVGDAEEAITL